jgi:hypothetical protein
MIRMEMCNEEIFDLTERDIFALQYPDKLREGSGPATIDQEFSIFDVQGVIVGGGITNVNNVHQL